MCMTIKTVFCLPHLVGFRLLTLSLQEHDPITKFYEQIFSKYYLNNTDINKSLFRWEGKKSTWTPTRFSLNTGTEKEMLDACLDWLHYSS